MTQCIIAASNARVYLRVLNFLSEICHFYQDQATSERRLASSYRIHPSRRSRPFLHTAQSRLESRHLLVKNDMSSLHTTKLSAPDDDQMGRSSPIFKNEALMPIAAVPQKEPTTFLSLPIELRTRIYKLSLATTSPAILPQPLITSNTWCRHLAPQKPISNVNLLRSCRQIYLEASQHAYLHRTFGTARPCKLCFTNLSLNDSVALRALQPSTIQKIRALELRVNVDCSTKLALCKKLLKTQIQLNTIGNMQSLRHLTIKVVFFRHNFSRLEYLIFATQCPGFEKLFTQIFKTVPGPVEINWEVEINQGKDMKYSKREEMERAGTKELSKRAEKFRCLQGVGGNARLKKPRKRRVVKTSSSSSSS